MVEERQQFSVMETLCCVMKTLCYVMETLCYVMAKRQNIENELPRLIGAQYATGEQWRNNSRKNEETEPKQKQYPVVDVTCDGSKVQSCKEQYCI